jgi:DNA-binding winged helix-turn-helix (wHTH) protein/tetratricopeptide (TPR) repeat protein
MGQNASHSEPESRRFVFAGVELDASTQSMRVDGHPVACSRKAFDLLLQLCLKPGRVQTRDELIGALWPGGQIVSDEALTQVIFRARAVLGPYAVHLLTVRGVGLRIGIEVRQLPALAAAPATAEAVAAVTPLRRASDMQAANSIAAAAAAPPRVESLPPPARSSLRRWPWMLVPIALVAIAIMLIADRGGGHEVVVDEGYALFETDLHAQQPGTAGMIREAFLNDARGERARGQALLEAVHKADADTPVPAIFIALWAAGAGDAESARNWLAIARARVGASRDVYLNLLLDYVEAEAHGEGTDVIRQAGAILDVRSGAWRMRSARSHLMIASGMRDAALHEVQQIDVQALGHRKLDMVIADRASMGDVEGAQAMLDRLPKGDGDAAAYAFLNGRIAWSRGDFDAAHQHFSEAASRGFESARSDLQRRALINIAAIEVLRDHDEAAVAALERARVGMNVGSRIDEIDCSVFLAELHARAGRVAQMQAELDRALAVSKDTNAVAMRLAAALAAKRLRPELDLSMPPDMDAEGEALWRARLAYNAGDKVRAEAALTDARHRGILTTRLVEEARFLALQLGQDVPAEEAMDPPYPPLSLFVLRRDLRRAAMGKSP